MAREMFGITLRDSKRSACILRAVRDKKKWKGVNRKDGNSKFKGEMEWCLFLNNNAFL